MTEPTEQQIQAGIEAIETASLSPMAKRVFALAVWRAMDGAKAAECRVPELLTVDALRERESYDEMGFMHGDHEGLYICGWNDCRDALLKFAQQELHSIHDRWLSEKRQRQSIEQDYTSLLKLVTDIRRACGDEGRRMQDELVAYIGELKQESDLHRTYAAEALDDIQEWAGYAHDYFREKYALDADLAKWKRRAGK